MKLSRFVDDVERAIEAGGGEAATLDAVCIAMRALVAVDDWLEPALACPDPGRYQQYLLHLDASQRFSVVSFVWGPGQSTPVHDHGVWGVIGMLRGSEWSQAYALSGGALQLQGARHVLAPGDVTAVSPMIGDLHKVGNAQDAVSVSIHVYGCDIGTQSRFVYDETTGAAKSFVSGYSKPRHA